MGITEHILGQSLMKALMVLHSVVFIKSNRSSCVKNEQRELEREVKPYPYPSSWILAGSGAHCLMHQSSNVLFTPISFSSFHASVFQRDRLESVLSVP